MERVVEGVDTMNPSLILEASKEFEAGVAELKKSIDQFENLIKKFPELSDLANHVGGAGYRLEQLDLEKVPKEYSFKAHKKVLRGKSDEEQPDAVISDIALKFPATVNALKDAILAVAEWFEEYSNFFSVGKNGILFQQAFQQVIADPKSLKINDFSGPGEEILKKISGKDGDEMKAHFEPLWKTEDVVPEKEDEAWEAFVTGFEKIGQGAQTAHDEASKVVKDAEPPDNIKKGASSLGGMLKGLITSLFGGGGSDETPDISDEIQLIVGSSKDDDAVGLFAMTFVSLQELIGGVIQSAEAASSAGGKALQGIDSQQKETMQPDDSEAAFIKELQGIVKDQEITVDIGAAAEEAGMKDGNKESIDPEKFEQVLGDSTDLDEEQLKHLLGELGLDDDDEDTGDGETPEEIARNAISDQEEQDAFVDLMKSEEYVDGEGNPNPDKKEEEIDDLIDSADEEIDDEEKENLKGALTVQEESVFRRWGQLAGIITG